MISAVPPAMVAVSGTDVLTMPWSLIAIGTLIALLIARQLAMAASYRQAQVLVHALDVAIVPLILAFTFLALLTVAQAIQ